MTFEVGDQVVYPSQGAGVVKEKTTREVLGETQDYLKIVFIRGDMEVLVPLRKGQEVGLRHTVSNAEISHVFQAVAKADLSLPNQWPPRYRAEQEILASGSTYDLARLIGVLSQRDLEKGLAATERDVLENAKTMLISELAVVQGTSLQEATEQLENVITENID
ncbi:MAG: hypothetical protein JSV66_05645 [Trueperaceae bacterium]|nr:MAG: hypothetical protein JSV66_05645 [Trueperaceae bacterium]